MSRLHRQKLRQRARLKRVVPEAGEISPAVITTESQNVKPSRAKRTKRKAVRKATRKAHR